MMFCALLLEYADVGSSKRIRTDKIDITEKSNKTDRTKAAKLTKPTEVRTNKTDSGVPMGAKCSPSILMHIGHLASTTMAQQDQEGGITCIAYLSNIVKTMFYNVLILFVSERRPGPAFGPTDLNRNSVSAVLCIHVGSSWDYG